MSATLTEKDPGEQAAIAGESKWKAEALHFGLRLALALMRLTGLAVVLLVHVGLNWLLHNLLYPADQMVLARRFFDIVFLVAFSLVYVKVLWEMVELFWGHPRALSKLIGPGARQKEARWLIVSGILP